MTPRRRYIRDNRTQPLIELPHDDRSTEQRFKPAPYAVWTARKAKLVEHYLRRFLYVTKSGAYIDGFAGPQNPNDPESWAARLILELKPHWLTDFYLFEQSPRQIARIKKMVGSLPVCDSKAQRIKRNVKIVQGDMNVELPRFLAKRPIPEARPTFCLLDQWTAQCHWATVKAVAEYKKVKRKVELFYFFPTGWVKRSLSKLSDEKIAEWWGRSDWPDLAARDAEGIRWLFEQRLKDLGYRWVYGWPIFEMPGGGGRILYHMVHATDHEKAPGLMENAYHEALKRRERHKQAKLWEP